MSTEDIGIVILSRFSSSRLPGKALMEINGKTTLEYIIERLLQVVEKSQIVLATSDEESDEPIEAFANKVGIKCYRGSLNNVSERFYYAGVTLNTNYIARINGDNIFMDIPLLQHMLQTAKKGSFDFISNVKDRTFPKGMSIEIVRTKYYKTLLPLITSSDYHKEHVTSYLYEHPEQTFCFIMNEELPEAAGIQMALDTKDDLERTKNIIAHFNNEHWNYNLKEIFQIWKNIGYE